MIQLVYSLVLILIPYIIIKLPEIYHRLFLKNNVEDQAAPLVHMALRKIGFGKEFQPHEYTEVIFNKLDDSKVHMEVEVFIHNYNRQGWNPYNNLVKITGIRTKKDGTYYYTVESISSMGSRDLGKLIPTYSNKVQDEYSRSDHN